MSPVDKFMEQVTRYYHQRQIPAIWVGDKGKRHLELQLKTESGYFVAARLHPREEEIIFEDEWGRRERLRPTRRNLRRVNGWAEPGKSENDDTA